MDDVGELVGRDAELTAVEGFLDYPHAGRRELLIEGAAGIGKTAVWRAAVEAALARSHRVLVAEAAQGEARLSFAVLGDLLAGLIDEVAPVLPAPQRRALEIALLLRDAGDEDLDRRALGLAVHAALLRLASTAPVLVAVDDLQWVDEPTARILAFALRRVQEAPVAVLASLRTGTAGPAHEVEEAIGEQRLVRLSVGPLPDTAVERLVRARAGGFSRLTMRRLCEASAGNPLHALEIARALRRRGAEPGPEDPLPVPDDLRGLLRERLAALSGTAQEALLVASAVPDPTAVVVESVLREPVALALWEARQAAVVELGDERVHFTHPMLRSVLYQDAPGPARFELHRRLAAVLTDPEAQARHLALGSTEPDESVATALEAAATRARTRGAPESAAWLAERAGRLTPAGREGDACRRLLAAADHHFEAGDMDAARSLLEQLVATLPPGPTRAGALGRLGRVRHHTDSAAAAVDLIERALAEAGFDARLRAPLELELCAALSWLGRTDEAVRHGELAAELAVGVDDAATQIQALGLLALSSTQVGRDPTEALERGRSLEQRIGLPSSVRMLGLYEAHVLMWRDELEAARVLLEEQWRLAAQRGDEGVLPVLTWPLADCLFRSGRWGLARTYVEQGCEIARRTGRLIHLSSGLGHVALLAAATGEVETMAAAVQEGTAITERTGTPGMTVRLRQAVALLELSRGNAAAAAAQLEPLSDELSTRRIAEPGVLTHMAEAIEALVAVGDQARAEAALDPFEARARELGRRGALAAAGRCRALLLAARADQAGAEAAIGAATEALEALPMPFELARTLLVRGRIERRARRKRTAQELMERARSLFEELGARLWAEQARAEMARLGIRPPAPDDLTPTERRVAAMAGSGMTNREVAAALFMSPKTVEANLARVYRKLGIRSRAELGSRLARDAPVQT